MECVRFQNISGGNMKSHSHSHTVISLTGVRHFPRYYSHLNSSMEIG